MLFQCSARLTLIWLSGSALLPCQAVWAMVKLFEGGWRRGLGCLCQAETGCRDAGPASVPRLSHKLPLTFSLLYHNRLFIPCICSLGLPFSPFFSLQLSLSLPHTCRDKHTHMHSFPSLSLQSLIKGIMTVWFGGNSDALSFSGFSPLNYQNTTLRNTLVDVN